MLRVPVRGKAAIRSWGCPRSKHRPFQFRTELRPLRAVRGQPNLDRGGKPREGTSPFQIAAELRFPPFAHRASVVSGDRRRGRSVENAAGGALSEGGTRIATAPSGGTSPVSMSSDIIGKPTPGDTKTDPPGSTAPPLTGLSTLCPRRRSPDNQVAVGRGWITPWTTLADGEFRLRNACAACAVGVVWNAAPGTEHRPNQTGVECLGGGGGRRKEHRANQSGAELRFPPFAHRASVDLGDRRRGRSVENAPGPVRFRRGGTRIATAPPG